MDSSAKFDFPQAITRKGYPFESADFVESIGVLVLTRSNLKFYFYPDKIDIGILPRHNWAIIKTEFESDTDICGNNSALAGCIAFEGQCCLASGQLPEVAIKIMEVMHNPQHGPTLIFDAVTSQPIEIDFRGNAQQVLDRLAPTPPAEMPSAPSQERRGPGRPKLGVVGREVTLLPRHWEWLDGQPGGASVASRKLVEEARGSNQAKDLARQSQDSVYRFMSVMAGNLPGFEEALRGFYRGNHQRVEELICSWPADIRDHVRRLIAAARRNEVAVGKDKKASAPI